MKQRVVFLLLLRVFLATCFERFLFGLHGRSLRVEKNSDKTRYAWSRLKLTCFLVSVSVSKNIQMILDQEYVLRQLFNISTMIGYLNEFCCFSLTKRNEIHA